ncbi:MAG: hypothetical protein JHC95_23875, partial [Solirubrobacteraceae bacterium]|nr:hypothetical protein [Solirubrobacteraceae bacterium]
MPAQLPDFEDRLLTELRQVVAERPSPANGAPAPRPRRRMRLALPGAGIAVAAATAAAIVIATSGDGPETAYAVEPSSDGTISVTIHSPEDAAGLERQLRAAGVPADVRYGTGPVECSKSVPKGAAAGGVIHVERAGKGDGGPKLETSGSDDAPPKV